MTIWPWRVRHCRPTHHPVTQHHIPQDLQGVHLQSTWLEEWKCTFSNKTWDMGINWNGIWYLQCMKTKDYLQGEHQVKMYPKRDSGIKAPHLTLNFKWFIMRNNTKCIYKNAKLLYYKQQSLLLQMATTGSQNTQGYVVYNTKNLTSVYALVGFVLIITLNYVDCKFYWTPDIKMLKIK